MAKNGDGVVRVLDYVEEQHSLRARWRERPGLLEVVDTSIGDSDLECVRDGLGHGVETGDFVSQPLEERQVGRASEPSLHESAPERVVTAEEVGDECTFGDVPPVMIFDPRELDQVLEIHRQESSRETPKGQAVPAGDALLYTRANAEFRGVRLVLLNPPGLKPQGGLQMHTPNPPIGLAYIASSLRRADHDIQVIDAVGEAPDNITLAPFRRDFMVQGLAVPEVVSRIRHDPEVIGITCMFSSQWLIAREVIAGVRARFPRTPIVCGGEHMSATATHVLETSAADVVVNGEGEETIHELLDAFAGRRPLASVTGITYRTPEGVRTTAPRKRLTNVDAIARPAWDIFPIESYITRHQMHGVNRGRAMPLLATRGCPYQCTFCSSPQMWTQRWIARDPRLVVDEIEHYVQTYGANDFHFQDLTAIIRKDWIIAFAKEVLARDLKITYQLPSGTRSEAIDEEVCQHLFASGCRNMAYAPESGSDAIRHEVKKQVHLDRMIESIQAALGAGLSLSCFFVIGFPSDTEETLTETLRLVRKLAWIGLHDIGVAKFVPYPGSALFKKCLADGTISLNDDYFLSLDAYADGTHTRSFCSRVSARRLHAWQLKLLANFYALSALSHPLRTVKTTLKVVMTGREETRYAKMIRDVMKTRSAWQRQTRQQRVPV